MKKIFMVLLITLFVFTLSAPLFAQGATKKSACASSGKTTEGSRVTGFYDWFGGWGKGGKEEASPDSYGKNRTSGIYNWMSGWGKYGKQESK